ncbi:MAG: hypothetical protein AUK24_09765 [Syntrophaceae bacterium CG2_30_49_12]|nr:MAG: hypothetical protein AUK24_09765 [Syntrophaceae bacterium CG2_30_49_12]PIP07668.1 MAG: hypothetical protein COX52_02880 [Syntrophobacterales bacterium CG23_combo_of_CG06-09_8_20_14_all_48_27]PJA50199.1 MAG: hypothetical protein CO171_03075 [Syntrophobacterales bacterium CG_4_9_14_3_um_filter_49_8]PJC73946.1 MAG: hypothetical protein CO012_07760 [Syntrophobacterales bacterium CG_4_8_14_3_um_filter_49_14]
MRKEDNATKESDLRKWHRVLGISLVLFVIMQAGSGLLITIDELGTGGSHSQVHSESISGIDAEGEESPWSEVLKFVHHRDGLWGFVYRILVGTGTLGMAITGSMIFMRIRARKKNGRHTPG